MICRSIRTLPSVAAASAAIGLTITAASADPDNGQRLAQRWCASCHIVAPDQKQGSADAPPFAAIARMPGFSRDKLVFFLLDPNPKMPDMSLTRREASDLAEYVAVLRAAQ
jgi:mono/diheme cytochrome c family protein